MKNSKILKLVTLLGFCIFLSAFISFKAGFFDKYLTTNTAGNAMPQNRQANNVQNVDGDTSPIKKGDSIRVNPKMFSTSKSVILVDQKIEFSIKDTLKGDSLKATIIK